MVGSSSLRGWGATSLVAVEIASTILAINDHLKLLLPINISHNCFGVSLGLGDAHDGWGFLISSRLPSY